MADEQETTPPALSDNPPSYEELMARAQAGLGKEQEGTDPPKKKVQPPEHPVTTFWQRVLHGAPGKSRLGETARSVGRGLLNAVTETGDTIAEGAAYVDRKTGLGEKLTPGFNAAYDESNGKLGQGTFTQNADGENVSDHYLGKRSDDPLASFTESATQFTAGFAALGGMGEGATVLGGLARGAVVDASMFNPQEAQLAELAAKAPVPVLKQVGELLSVKGDDSQLVARLKRAAAGIVPAAAMEGLIAGARYIRAGKAGDQAAVQVQADILKGLEDGSQVPEGSHVAVKPEGDGFVIEHSGEQSPVFPDRAEAEQQAASMDMGLTAQATVGKVDEDAAGRLVAAVENPESIRSLGDDTFDGLGGSYHNTVDDDAKLVADLSSRIHAALPGIRQGDNTLGDADLKELATNLLGYVPENKAYDVVGSLLEGDTRIQSVSKIMAEMVAGSKGRQLAKMSDMIDARPHDPVLTSEAVTAVQNYFDFTHRFGMVESDAARMLRLAQQRESMRATPVSIGRKVQEAVAPGLAKDLRSAERAAETDALTGVGNRAALDKALPAAEADPNTSVLFFDANNFGKVNKVVGDKAGDEALKGISKAITQAADEAGVGGRVFRKGGDEFVVLAPKEQADAIRHRAETIYGEKTHEGPTGDSVNTSITGTTGATLEEASSGVQAAKAARKAGGGIVPAAETPPVAGMATRDASARAVDEANVAATLRMIKMAGGDPRNVSSVVRGTAIQWNKSIGARVYEYFANSLLSGIKTMETITGSGLTVSGFEPIVRMASGIATGNRALAREGADMLYGNFAYLSDNLRSAAAAFKAKRSIMDPVPPRYANGGVTGDIIRTPGRVVGMLDEFLTATNYRSYIRAKSLRIAREQGLEGPALDARVAEDLKASFDPNTGIATVPEALKYAEVPSFKQPLGSGFGKAWQDMAQDNLTARFITPFVKAPVNIFRYVLDSTPGLNMIAKRNRDIMAAGGEEAAMLHTRSALATAMYGYGLYQARAGNLTGRGPTDPELRKMWLAGDPNTGGSGHQEYSLKIGNTWVSYRRMDPFGMPLGLIADAHTFLSELGDKDVDAEHYAAAVVASIGQNMVSRSYMSGLADFMSAFAEGNANKTMRYAQGFLGNAVPQLAASLNPDPYYREMRSVMDGVIARIPGYSETLPPRYNAFGEKSLKTEGVLNRGANMFTLKDATPTVEDNLVDLKRALPAFPQKLEGHIDLSDTSFRQKESQLSPYERLMQLVRSPEDGRPGLRQAMEDLVKTEKWKEASSGADLYPGGARWILAATTKEAYEQRALKQVLNEYPKLRTQYEATMRIKGAAITGGEPAVKQVESMMGVTR